MAAEALVEAGKPASPAIRQLEGALNKIGLTRAHKQIILLILIGCLFDSFEQNTIGVAGPALRAQWGLTGADIGFLNTITFGSAALGRLLSGIIGDRYGRRVMLAINLLLFTIGSAACAVAPNFTALCFARAVVGFGVGGEISTAVTMLAEFCSPRFRGTAAGLVNVAAGGFGNFLAPAFGLLIFTLFPGENGWRWLFAALALPALLVTFYRRLVPETPRFLVAQNRIAEANQVLSRLASGSLARTDVPVQNFLTVADTAEPPPKSAWRDLFRMPYLGRTVAVAIAILMSYGAQLSVLTLMPSIFVSMGYTYSGSLLYAMIIQSGSVLGAIAASCFGYYFPRKRVLTFGSVLACVAALSIIYLGVNIYLVLLFGAVFQFFVLLLNTSIWIYAPELYPTRIRAFGVAFILATGSAAGSFIPTISGALFDHYGMVGVFALAAGMYAVFALCIQLGPETYGKSMEDVNRSVEDDLSPTPQTEGKPATA
ncbi:putative transport protein [Azorhizobium caulinodans ORS 571]|uniref:Putative transport protein n=1 Tax=Azorhizobium caulinodans (strain ATCC 43989 / DSM 5975 / JCM 20966 / LMG 6465 / NBRC 14845 / NCIMB 13405 / ORS 571) TaxID=438753 RepID=A8I2N0_AZOC5|nr:MFS transporter [Azorhizobium caulinodans]BAF87902.1 putative transport protein [Azorhizobium caulinodans ORS 571]